VSQWVAGLTHNQLVVRLSLNPIKGSRCFLEQETLSLFLIPGWFQEGMQT